MSFWRRSDKFIGDRGPPCYPPVGFAVYVRVGEGGRERRGRCSGRRKLFERKKERKREEEKEREREKENRGERDAKERERESEKGV